MADSLAGSLNRGLDAEIEAATDSGTNGENEHERELNQARFTSREEDILFTDRGKEGKDITPITKVEGPSANCLHTASPSASHTVSPCASPKALGAIALLLPPMSNEESLDNFGADGDEERGDSSYDKADNDDDLMSGDSAFDGSAFEGSAFGGSAFGGSAFGGSAFGGSVFESAVEELGNGSSRQSRPKRVRFQSDVSVFEYEATEIDDSALQRVRGNREEEEGEDEEGDEQKTYIDFEGIAASGRDLPIEWMATSIFAPPDIPYIPLLEIHRTRLISGGHPLPELRRYLASKNLLPVGDATTRNSDRHANKQPPTQSLQRPDRTELSETRNEVDEGGVGVEDEEGERVGHKGNGQVGKASENVSTLLSKQEQDTDANKSDRVEENEPLKQFPIELLEASIIYR